VRYSSSKIDFAIYRSYVANPTEFFALANG
jgi:hypothetical protein